MNEIRVLIVVECAGLGDIISSTPAIRTMAEKVYKHPVSVASHMPEFYDNLPYVANSYHIKEELKDYHIIRTFNTDKIKKYDIMHEKVDIRQFHSLCCGFMLLPDQMTCDFIPSEDPQNLGLPHDYVVLHTAQTWDSRTWIQESWQMLAHKLETAHIPIVTVGKTNNSAPDVPKPVFKIDGVIDLTDQLSLSQCWHVLNNAKVVVTMDSGILHLAGTTDTHIVQLGSSIHPYFRAPYRHGTQQYKYDYIMGSCGLFCGSSMEYMLRKDVPVSISQCAERYETFECHPPVDKVLKKVLTIYN